MPTPLSEVKLADDEVLLEGFVATLRGDPVVVTAVLERTCVYVTTNGERKLASKQELMVEPDELTIRRRRQSAP
jgi:hypothetical protein